MKLVVTNDWWSDKQAHVLNKDGILKALDVLQKEHGWDIVFIKQSPEKGTFRHPYVLFKYFDEDEMEQAVLDEKPDAVLFFCDMSRPLLGRAKNWNVPIALAFTGGLYDDFEDVPDIVFVESQTYFDRFKEKGLNVRRAFGTNTEIFYPFKQPKIFDAVFPATMALWKRHNLFAEAMKGRPACASGWFQPHEPQAWQVCQDNGIALLHHQNAESVNLLYNMSHTVLITSSGDGGSQRAVLEAMACGIPLVVTSDSDKTTEYVRESGFGIIADPYPDALRDAVDELIANPLDPQIGIDYIKSKYTEQHYAQQLKEGIESIIK